MHDLDIIPHRLAGQNHRYHTALVTECIGNLLRGLFFADRVHGKLQLAVRYFLNLLRCIWVFVVENLVCAKRAHQLEILRGCKRDDFESGKLCELNDRLSYGRRPGRDEERRGVSAGRKRSGEFLLRRPKRLCCRERCDSQLSSVLIGPVVRHMNDDFGGN